jgi:pilus assembly protein Flp/PilA
MKQLRELTALFAALRRNRSGATAIEYAFIALLISTVAIAAMTTIGGWLSGTFAGFANSL